MKSKKAFITIICVIVIGAMAGTGAFMTKLLSMESAKEVTAPVPTTGEGTGYYRHCYEELNAQEQNLYAVILNAVYSMPEKIQVPELTEGDFSKVFEALSYDNPDLFCLGVTGSLRQEGKKIYFIPAYDMSYEQYSAMLSEANGIASAITSTAVQFTSDYEKELYIHDYLVNHCTYAQNESNINNIYGCLVNGRASCEGYSRTFQYLLSAVGIDNRLITGEAVDASGTYIGHMWNYAVLDGEGYFTDLTWDDPSTDGSVLRHTYFNITTNETLKTHKDIRQTVPLCSATKFNYFTYENALLGYGDAELFTESLENVITVARNRGYQCAEIKFNEAQGVTWAVDAMFKQGVIFTAYKNLGLLDAIGDNGVYYSADDKTCTISIYY